MSGNNPTLPDLAKISKRHVTIPLSYIPKLVKVEKSACLTLAIRRGPGLRGLNPAKIDHFLLFC
jgi:hypothetical protein